jgi:hypothetical protein
VVRILIITAMIRPPQGVRRLNISIILRGFSWSAPGGGAILRG